jgi:predicted porin
MGLESVRFTSPLLLDLMKNPCFLLALAGFTGMLGMAGIARAQSSVTLYGDADASFDAISVRGGGRPALHYNRVSTNGAVLGFKGREALGNDTAALFQFESNVSFDTGGAIGTSRSSFVGLTGAWGTLIMGRFTGPARSFGIGFDVNTTNDSIASGNAILGKLGGKLASNPGVRSAVTSSRFDTNLPNALAYRSPTFHDWQWYGVYSANEKKSLAAGQTANVSTLAQGLTWQSGGWQASGVFERVGEKNAAGVAGIAGVGSDEIITESRLGVLWQGDAVSVRGVVARTQASGQLATGRAAVYQRVWGAGVTWDVQPSHRLTSQVYRALNLSGSALGEPGSTFLGSAGTGARLITLGYEWHATKRTLLKANYAFLRNGDYTASLGGGGYDFGKTATGFRGDGMILSGLQLGMRLDF